MLGADNQKEVAAVEWRPSLETYRERERERKKREREKEEGERERRICK